MKGIVTSTVVLYLLFLVKVSFFCGKFKIKASLYLMSIIFSYRKKLKHLDDEQLITAYSLEKDKRIVDEIYYRYSHLVLGTCMKYLKNKMDAEDLTLSIFSKLPEKLLKHEVKHFKSWCHTLTKNECLMLLRKPKPTFIEPTENLTTDDSEDEQEEYILLEGRLIGLENSLLKLKSSQRQCIELFYLHRKSYEEIMKITGFSSLQVKSNIQNGRRSLRILMDKNNY